MLEILDKNDVKYPCYTTVNLFKRHSKSFVFDLQTSGSQNEWEETNTPLYNVPGIPRTSRDNIPKISYAE